MMKKKIYFAGSIRGGRDFADLYRKMIEHMQMTDIVLTEHIGQANLNLKEKGRISVVHSKMTFLICYLLDYQQVHDNTNVSIILLGGKKEPTK